MTSNITGLYGILPADLPTNDLLLKAEQSLQGGLQTLQFRDKKSGYKRALKRALALRELTSSYDACLIVNDSVQMAKEVRADGVHLGRDDVVNLAAVRDDLGDTMLIGMTCRADAVFATLALQQGADYVSFGAVFASQSKPDVPVLGLPRLQKARQMFPDINICAIGGITLDNIAQVKQAGATSAAIISGIFDGEHVQETTIELMKAWQTA
ncbi:MAG: thiamine phosphate synthase [Mariprofundaceae bacterium]|nr:thiamine phosphate synthase [Mariprofundaceae bacterium]